MMMELLLPMMMHQAAKGNMRARTLHKVCESEVLSMIERQNRPACLAEKSKLPFKIDSQQYPVQYIKAIHTISVGAKFLHVPRIS